MKKLIRNQMLLLCLMLTGSFIYAQSVSGVVSDATGPLPGVNVIVKGTSKGTQTDFDGNFALDDLNNGDVLAFSFLGYTTQDITYNGQATLNVTMQEDAAQLDEVVIIGYGTTTVKDATGSVSAVTSDDFNGGVISSPEQLIQGKTAGVQITGASGEPGAGIAIRIRGTASVRSNNDPLFVVDGVPLSTGNAAGAADLGVGSGSARNPLSFLNPSDIESMSILKDASATAIYGSRGANGVVIITTKSGKKGTGGVFEFSSNQSRSSVAETFDLLSKEQFLANVLDPAGLNYGYNTNWQNVIFRNVLSTDNSLSYSNNYGDGYVRGSFGYGKQFGVVENSSQEKITGRISASHRFLDDKLKFDLNASISRINDEAALISDRSGSLGDLLGAAYLANPSWPNSPSFTNGSDLNPAQLLAYYQDLSNTNRVLLNFSTEYSILENLKAKVNLGYDHSYVDRNQVLSSEVDGFNNGTPGNGRGSFQEVNVKNELMDVTLNYTKDFENSSLEVLVGYGFQSFQDYGSTVNGFGYSTVDLNDMASDLERSADIIENNLDVSYQQYGYSAAGLFINQLFPDINAGVQITDVPGGVLVSSISGNKYNHTDELQSFFSRINYKLANKYLFTFTMRADGSTRFGPDNQYGYFPSGAFAWQLHEENFIPEAFSTLKLRLGYGITGNQDGLGYGNFLRRQRFGDPEIANDGTVNLGSGGNIAFQNDELKWEETAQATIGLDYGFFNGRLNGSIDVYHKSTKDLLLQSQSDQPAAQPFVFENLDAKVINKGVEFSINYDFIQQEDTNWNLGFNISYNENEVQDFDGIIDTGEANGNGLTGAFTQRLAEGYPLFSYYLRQFGGFDSDGISIYPNGDVQEFVGKSALPDINLGISSSFSYKNWDLNAYLTGQYGHYIYNNTANAYFTAGIIGTGKNVTTDVIGNGESSLNAPDVSTRFLEKGDYLRLQSASIGYNVKLKEKSFFKSLRLSLTGQNLFVITPYSGLDPEVNTPKGLNNVPSLGIDYTSYPRPRTYTFGLNATF